MPVWKLINETLAIFLSWPVVMAGMAIFFFVFFREGIGQLLKNADTIEAGKEGLKVSRQQKDPSENQPDNQVDREQLDNLLETIGGLRVQNQTNQEHAQKTIEQLWSERALWEYQYLNFFLVYKTQVLLDWLAAQSEKPATPKSFLDSFVPDMVARQNTFGALTSHQLIDMEHDSFKISAKGKEYVQWRGPMQPLA